MRSILFAFVALATYLPAAEPPRPAHLSPEPGRLVGWGEMYGQAQVADTIPEGMDAEGFVEVSAGRMVWIARHQDGFARIHDTRSDSPAQVLRSPKRVVQVDASSGHWVVRFEDGTVQWGGNTAPKQSNPASIQDAVWVGAAGNGVAVLRQEGALTFFSDLEALKKPFPAPFQRPVQSVALGTNILAIRGENPALALTGLPQVNAQTIKVPPAGLTMMAAGRRSLVGLTGDQRVVALNGLAKNRLPESDPDPYQRVAAGEGHLFGQRLDGTWVAWGPNYSGEGDPENLNDLLAFAVAGYKEQNYGYLVGIEPGAQARVNQVAAQLPALKAILDAWEGTKEAPSPEIAALETNYLKALDQLTAKSGTNPALLAALTEERKTFRDLDRPLSPHPQLAKLQGIYRDRIPDLLSQQQKARQASYQNLLTRLTELQDQLTQDQKLQEAVQVREVRDKLVLLNTVPTPPAATPTEPAPPAFSPIPPSQVRFQQSDPVRPGKLVAAGTWGGRPIELPRSAQRESFVSVSAKPRSWIALQENGDFHCDGLEPHRRFDQVPGGIRRLQWASAGNLFGYLGIDTKGEVKPWGAVSGMEPLPEFLFEHSYREVSIRSITNGTTAHQVLGLRQDGTVDIAGAAFEQEPNPWKRPPQEALRGGTHLLTSHHFGGFLKADGSAVVWDQTGLVDLPDSFSQLYKVVPGSGSLVGLRRDGTIVLHGSGPEPPKELDQVVDIACAAHVYLALRADGTWVTWSAPPQFNLPVLLPQFQGVRRLALGATNLDCYLLGIKEED